VSSAAMKKMSKNSKHIKLKNKKYCLDVMQAWHGLSKYNSATAVSIYAQSKKKIKIKKIYYQDRNHKCIQVR
jgi:hypothetical protein